MVYFKGVAAGLGAAVAGVLLASLWDAGALLRAVWSAEDTGVVVVHWHVLPVLCVMLPAFAVGFWWQYRKARRAGAISPR